jgi:hypothetical protein
VGPKFSQYEVNRSQCAVRAAQQYVARKETDQSFEWVAVIVDRGEDSQHLPAMPSDRRRLETNRH